MNDPQIWTLISVFAAALIGGFSIMTAQFSRVIRAEIGRLDGRLTGQIDALDGRLTGHIDAVDGKLTGHIDAVEARLTGRIDTLDKEVANLAERFWRSP